jgi:hypothetical protein
LCFFHRDLHGKGEVSAAARGRRSPPPPWNNRSRPRMVGKSRHRWWRAGEAHTDHFLVVEWGQGRCRATPLLAIGGSRGGPPLPAGRREAIEALIRGQRRAPGAGDRATSSSSVFARHQARRQAAISGGRMGVEVHIVGGAWSYFVVLPLHLRSTLLTWCTAPRRTTRRARLAELSPMTDQQTLEGG